MDSLTFPANFRLLQLWFSVQLCYYIYAKLSIKKKTIFDIMLTILYNIFTAVNGGAPVRPAASGLTRPAEGSGPYRRPPEALPFL